MAERYPYVNANLCTDGAAKAIEFYKQAFGAEERYRMTDDSGRIGHAEITIGETVLMLSDEWAEHHVLSPRTLKGNSVSFVLSVKDCDAAFQRAIDAGATIERPIVDAPYGRGGWLIDPFGHRWHVTTPNENFKPESLG